MCRLWITTALFLALHVVARPTAGQNALTPDQWREDLQYLATQIPKMHPDAFHHITRAAFDSAVASVDAEVPSLTDHAVEIEIARLIAMLGEGHSRLSLPGLPDPMSDVPSLTPFKDPRLAFHRLPLKLYSFSDGLFVVAATPEYQSLVGGRVLAIADHPTDSVLATVAPLVNRDNDMGIRLIAADYATVPEILVALHLVADPSQVALTVRTTTGMTLTREVAPLPVGAEPTWTTAVERAPVRVPFYLSHPDRNMWIDYVADSRTLWLRINVIGDLPHQSVAAFARVLDSTARAHPVDRFVIDLRNCHGGNNQLFRSVLLEIIRHASLDRPGKTFTLIDRGTFSAAVNAGSDLERLTNTIFVGEPTAGAPSSWGDPKKITLPLSGLIVRVSTIYWRDWTTDATRPWLAPDLSVPVASADYFSGRDPAWDAIRRFPTDTAFGSLLENVIRAGGGLDAISRLYYRRKTDAVWAGQSTEQAMQRVGVLLVARRAYADAGVVFRINVRDYPKSLAAAIAGVREAQTANPRDAGLNALLDELRSLEMSGTQ